MIKCLIILMFVATGLNAAETSLWSKYNTLKANKFESRTETARNYFEMGRVGDELDRNDIAGWGYNNAAFELIKEFKAITSYYDNNNAIEKAAKGQRKELRKAFRVVLSQHFSLLSDARSHLTIASTRDFDDNEFIKNVYSNDAFIDWVEVFMSQKE